MIERRVWLAQCLCPQRHCMLGAAGEAESLQEAERTVRGPLREQIEILLRVGVLNDYCGLCNASAETWTYEVGRTEFRTLAEATPTLERSEAEQMLTRALWGDLHKTKPN